MALEVHWHEGLFLQPHHLQRMQKSLHDQFCAERQLSWAYPYGLVEARLSRDELENKRVRFERLRAVMPSGQIVNYPENAELPSLDIKQAFDKSGAFNVSLGVPLWQDARANTVGVGAEADVRAKLLYRIGETECADENTGENPKPIQIRKVNSRLMLEHEDPSDMELLPLLRIVRATGEDGGIPKVDPEYVPACLVLSGSPPLRELVRDLVSQVEANRKAAVVQLTRGGFSIDTMGASPFAVYLELRELLGELAALQPDQDDFDAAPYDHDNPRPCFVQLDKKIRRLLKPEAEEIVLKVEFKQVGSYLTAALEDKHFTQPNAYFLGIQTKVDPIPLAHFVETPPNPNVPDKFKLMAQSLASKAIRGVELKEERHPPLELPARSDLHYFRLDRTAPASTRMWQQIQADKSAIVRWTGGEVDLADASFTLYMTIPGSSK
jgi:predicted component of type VI protein secretion system